MPPLSEHLTNEQSFALIHELYAVRGLLWATEQAIDGWSFEDYGYATLALASSGSERLLKLCFGLRELERRHEWPGSEIKERWGHNIDALDRHLRDEMQRDVDQATAPGFIQQRLAEVSKNEWLPDWLHLLTVYAKQGRYDNLDILAGKDVESPRQLLADLDGRAARLPHWDTPQHVEDFVRVRNARLIRMLQEWRNLYAYSMAHNVFGPVGKRVGLELAVRVEGKQ